MLVITNQREDTGSSVRIPWKIGYYCREHQGLQEQLWSVGTMERMERRRIETVNGEKEEKGNREESEEGETSRSGDSTSR